jgi:hypothetical protein
MTFLWRMVLSIMEAKVRDGQAIRIMNMGKNGKMPNKERLACEY